MGQKVRTVISLSDARLIDFSREGKRAQKYPSSSVLAPFDMNVLEAWFRAVQNARRTEPSNHIQRLYLMV